MTSNSGRIRVFINPELNEFSELAFAVIEEILRFAGWSSQRVMSESGADIIYSTNQFKSSVFLSAGYQSWLRIQDSYPVKVSSGDVVPSYGLIETEQGQLEDNVLIAHFFLSGILEQKVECVEKNGILGPGALNWGIGGEPIVNRIVAKTIWLIQNSHLPVLRKPFWPNGKSWALAVSHDCDRVFKYRPLNFLKEVIWNVKERDFRVLPGNFLKALYSVIAKLFFKDPYFESWIRWMQIEKELGIRSAFYIGTWNRFDPQSSVDDVRYNRDAPKLKFLVSQLLEGGWEIGLHSSALAWKNENRFAMEANRLYESYGIYPKGVRGHLWSLDPENPNESLVAIGKAGFLYDSSLGMNLIHGFRRGIAYPFIPYNSKTGEKSGLWELPPVMMDYSLFVSGSNNENRAENFIKRLESVKSNNGLLLLDWHEYVLARGTMDDVGLCLYAKLKKVIQDESCWIATPAEIHQWCAHNRWEND